VLRPEAIRTVLVERLSAMADGVTTDGVTTDGDPK
jgi:hypothetical protein